MSPHRNLGELRMKLSWKSTYLKWRSPKFHGPAVMHKLALVLHDYNPRTQEDLILIFRLILGYIKGLKLA